MTTPPEAFFFLRDLAPRRPCLLRTACSMTDWGISPGPNLVSSFHPGSITAVSPPERLHALSTIGLELGALQKHAQLRMVNCDIKGYKPHNNGNRLRHGHTSHHRRRRKSSADGSNSNCGKWRCRHHRRNRDSYLQSNDNPKLHFQNCHDVSRGDDCPRVAPHRRGLTPHWLEIT